MIEGGQRDGQTFIPLDDHSITAQANAVAIHLDELSKIGHLREMQPETSAIGSAVEQKFDFHSNHVIEELEILEAKLHKTVADKLY